MSNLRVRWATAVSGATLLVIAGCSANQGTDELPAPATLSAEPTDSIEPTDSVEPTDVTGNDPGTGSESGAEYTPAELETALTLVNEGESLAGAILTDEDIRELVAASGGEAPSDLTVSPEECNVFADTDIAQPGLNSSLAVMTFAGASSLQPDSLSLTSQTSDGLIQQQIEANRTQLQECSEFELTIAGEVVSAAVTELSATTDADRTFAVRTVVQVPGTIEETVSLTALLGTTTINATVGSSGDSSRDLARGEDLVDAAVAALLSLQS